LIENAGFVNITIGDPVDTFEGAHGESNARAFGVSGHSFTAQKP